ncbi:AraC family transcriptional regulator [Frondihabitans peucedani]|uniref:HTH araC/xylS-type domain-containing protein n=1 Tax=Frondihabitans peucedani TaxID=598626 RepID=A0ABP8E368_9MICO
MPSAPDPRVHIDAQGGDLEQAIDLFQDGYNGNTFAAERSEKPFFYRHTAIGDAAMTLRTTRFDGHVTGEIAPGDDYVISWLTEGRGHFDVGRHDAQLDLGQPMVFTTDRPFAFDFTDVKQSLVHFNRATLEGIVAEHRGTAPEALHLDHTVAPSEASVRSWRNTIALVSQTVRDESSSPILQAELTRLAAIALLGMFPPARAAVPAALQSARNAHLRTAVEYIHANAHLPITTTSVAAAAGISLRALQEGFVRHLEMTPNAFLRGVRLDRARDDLAAAGPGQVAVIAHRWGFGNLGRFSHAYSQRFGALPSTQSGGAISQA